MLELFSLASIGWHNICIFTCLFNTINQFYSELLCVTRVRYQGTSQIREKLVIIEIEREAGEAETDSVVTKWITDKKKISI